MFTESAALGAAYIKLKYSAYTKADCLALAKQALGVIHGCKVAKQELYETGPRVHGARQQSQLDLIDQWEFKACAVYDNASNMAATAK